MKTSELLFSLINNEIFGVSLEKGDGFIFDEAALYSLAKKHDLAHLLFDPIERNGIEIKDKELNKRLKKEKLMAIYRHEQQSTTFNNICLLFESEKIQYVPLKGSVIRQYYKEPWMRTSCDIDILIHEEDIEKATAVLKENGFTTDNIRNYHDIHFYLDKVHLELHYNICENNEQLDRLLSKVWNNVEPIKGSEYRESKEFFAFHHIAHMAYHFLSGGCGIRPFIDLQLMRQKHFYDDNGLIALLNKCELLPFYNSVCTLTDVWFGEKEHTELTKAMSDHILSGGVYGSEENGNSVGVARNNGSKIKYLFKIAFLPYESMCCIYPSLKKHKILLPFCYIHRIFLKLFGKDRKRVRDKANNIRKSDTDAASEKAELLKELNLK